MKMKYIRIIVLTSITMVMGAAPGYTATLAAQVAQMQKQIKILTAKVNKLSKPRKITASQLNGKYWFQSFAMGAWGGMGFHGFNNNGQNGVIIFRSTSATGGTFTFIGSAHNVQQDSVFNAGMTKLNPAGQLVFNPPQLKSTVTTAGTAVRITGTYRVSGKNKVIFAPKGAPKGVFNEGTATFSRDVITFIDNKETGVNGFGILVRQ